MPVDPVLNPELPRHLTWEELELLPDEIAGEIELWNGRVVRVRRGPIEHQGCTGRLWSAFERCLRDHRPAGPECRRAGFGADVFFGHTGKNDFLTPDFLVHRYPDKPYRDVRADDVLLVGEVLSPSDTGEDMETRRARYARGGIPWYWEVRLARDVSAVQVVRAYALETRPGLLPTGVQPLHRANYLLVDEWTPEDNENGIEF